MPVVPESLCMGCMEVKDDGRCPNPQVCGWVEGSSNESELQLQPRTRLNRKYLIGKVLGQGGFGITYMSCNLEDYRKLAVKEYFPRSFATRTTDHRTVTHSTPDDRNPYQYGLTKFTQEAKTLERLRGHANIVSVIEFFPANNTAYIVMEYLDGITLEHYLRKRQPGKIPFEDALKILFPVMDALREVHAAGLAHRDVSPDNIVLSKTGQIKLIDFGAAKQSIQGQRTQQLILKPGYTPEEQYRTDGVAGPYTDVYAVGATLYRCITGIVPPEAPVRMSDESLAPPGKLGAKLPPEAERAILRALAVRARDRYQTISELQQALKLPEVPASSEPRDRSAETFRGWWVAGLAVMFCASLCPPAPKLLLVIAGFVALVISSQAIGRLNRLSQKSAGPSGSTIEPRLLLVLLALIECLVTALSAPPLATVAVILLIPGLFIGNSAISRTIKETKRSSRVGLRFDAGDQAGQTVELGPEPIKIGRDPLQAHIIIPAPQVSGAHVKVWRDDSGTVHVEDLKSRNGTYIRRSTENSNWERLATSETLSAGDSFCLSQEETAAFQVVNL